MKTRENNFYIYPKQHLQTIIYHDIFEYPLDAFQVERWQVGKKVKRPRRTAVKIIKKNNFYCLAGREGIVLKRLARNKASKKKMKIARAAGNLLARIPTVRLVGITGALAMDNANTDSDIDLLIVTSKNTLWTTRILIYFMLLAFGYELRRPKDRSEKDKLCLNMWMDESSLVFRRRNIFTAHEIAQIVPIVNKNETYEKLLIKNKWVLDYWPKAVKIRNPELRTRNKGGETIIHYSSFIIRFFDLIAFKLQYWYMRPKITRETVTKTRAFFHPFNWDKYVQNLLIQRSSKNQVLDKGSRDY